MSGARYRAKGTVRAEQYRPEAGLVPARAFVEAGYAYARIGDATHDYVVRLHHGDWLIEETDGAFTVIADAEFALLYERAP